MDVVVRGAELLLSYLFMHQSSIVMYMSLNFFADLAPCSSWWFLMFFVVLWRSWWFLLILEKSWGLMVVLGGSGWFLVFLGDYWLFCVILCEGFLCGYW